MKAYNQLSYNPKIIIGDYTRIALNTHCTCAERVEIGKGVTITANCGLFDIIHPYDDINTNPRFADIKTAPVFIGDDCMIGMNSVKLPGTHLGKHCVVGANNVVSGVFSDYCVIVGSPAKIIKRYSCTQKKWIKEQ